MLATLPLAALVVVAVLALRTSSAFRESAHLLRQSAELDLQLERLLSLLKDAETGQRGYLLTGQDQFLAPYTNATARLPDLLPALRESLMGASRQDQEASRLTVLMQQRLDHMVDALQMRQQGDAAAAIARVKSGSGQALMDEVRASAALLQQELDRDVDRHQTRLNAQIAFNDRLTVVIVCLCGLVVVGVAWILGRLRRFDRLVTICAWSRTIKLEDRWVTFEEYLRDRFNIQVTHGISEKEYERIMAQQTDPSDQDPAGSHNAGSAEDRPATPIR
jgi:CHASE3 domain sensor protein